MQRLLVLFLVLLLAGSVLASVPQQMNFQGILTDSAGIPLVNDTASVVFTIYDAFTGGNPKWTETQTVVTGAGGIFTVTLGAVTTPMPDTVFNDSVRYLGVKVGGDAEMAPRTRIVSVGYSQRVSKIVKTGYVGATSWAEGRNLFAPDSFTYIGGLSNGSAGTYAYYEVPVDVPDGATITVLDVYCSDADPGNEMYCFLGSQPNGAPGGFIETFGFTGVAFSGGAVTISLPLALVVDNSLNSYYLEIGMPPGFSYAYYNYRLTYTYSDQADVVAGAAGNPNAQPASQAGIILPPGYKGTLKPQ